MRCAVQQNGRHNAGVNFSVAECIAVCVSNISLGERLEPGTTSHRTKTHILHGRPLKELEIFSVFMCILTVVF